MDRAPATPRSRARGARPVRSCRGGDAARPAPRARLGLARRRLRLGCAVLPRLGRRGRTVAGLRDADEAADHVAAPRDRRGGDVRRRAGRAAARALRRGDGRPRARVRRRERAQPPARPRHRPADGQAHREAARRRRSRAAGARARVRARPLRALVRPPRERRQRLRGRARARRQPLLRPRLHPLAEADDARRTS